LPKRHDLDAALHARPLFRNDEFPAGEFSAWLREQEARRFFAALPVQFEPPSAIATADHSENAWIVRSSTDASAAREALDFKVTESMSEFEK